MYDINHFTAIIDPPQSCILAIGSTPKKVPTPEEERSFKIVQPMKVSLAATIGLLTALLVPDGWLPSRAISKIL